jgi:GNAT superfamily N-acetyltransferase
MYVLKRTDSNNIDFQKLVLELDKDLALRNGDKDEFYAQFNKLDLIKNVVVTYLDDKAVGCGAMKEYDVNTMEIKRMFVPIDKRGKGIARDILNDLQVWAKELGYKKCILETGDKMIEAIGLYTKNGFVLISNYGQYARVESSVCFEKVL